MEFKLSDLPPALCLAVRNEVVANAPQEIASTFVEMLEEDISGIVRRHRKTRNVLAAKHRETRSGIERLADRVGSAGGRDPLAIVDSTLDAMQAGLLKGTRKSLISSLIASGVSDTNAEQVANEMIAKL